MGNLTVVSSQKPYSDLDSSISVLKDGSAWLRNSTLQERRELLDRCASLVVENAEAWTETACQAKRLSPSQAAYGEEMLAGPACLIRYLQLLSSVYQAIEKTGHPVLPGKPRKNSLGQLCVPILPVKELYDQIIFRGLRAEVWLRPDSAVPEFSDLESSFSDSSGTIAGVLGAGNVSAIPVSDMLHKIFHDGESVLLKFNPVNEYLEPIFAKVFKPLIVAKLLRLIRGGSDVGSELVNHPDVDSIHITGSHLTHDAIVWGSDEADRKDRIQNNQPLVTKPITSELGNVTPWIVVPGNYSQKQLRSQAQHIVASIVNNASFNCLSTKMIVTSRAWPQRQQFLDLIESYLDQVPDRYAYYPGAKERFERATGSPAPQSNDESLPWTLIRDANIETAPHLFQEESFVCVCAETALDASNDTEFLMLAVEFANNQLFGNLCSSITVTDQFQQQHKAALDRAICEMKYGSVCINQWSGVVYGMMTPPWGGYHSNSINSPSSGIGHVHNTFCLKNFDKTVLFGRLCNFPKPVWFSTHRTGVQVGWSLLRLYEKPSLRRLVPLLFHAARG